MLGTVGRQRPPADMHQGLLGVRHGHDIILGEKAPSFTFSLQWLLLCWYVPLPNQRTQTDEQLRTSGFSVQWLMLIFLKVGCWALYLTGMCIARCCSQAHPIVYRA